MGARNAKVEDDEATVSSRRLRNDGSGQPRRGDELRDAVSVRNVPRINANLRVRPMPRYTIPS